MTILDCESYAATLNSISELYGVSGSAISEFLSRIDSYDEANSLAEPFESEFRTGPRSFDRTFWFHLTRVPKGTDFAEGILPLNLALDKIWGTVESILQDSRARANLENLKKNGVPNEDYIRKTQDPEQWGPYAMLLKEAAFHADELGNHDYLAMPEIIRDICDGYEHRFGQSIQEEISRSLHPCVVKFGIREEDGRRPVPRALFYCWCKIKKRPPGPFANDCYVGKGDTIPSKAIRRVEFL